MKNDNIMATQTESYVNFRWGDNGTTTNTRSKTIHLQSKAMKAPPLIVRKLVGATDGVIKDFVINRAHYKRQYLRFVHLCCEEDLKKEKDTSAKFLLDLISKALQKVLLQRLTDRKSQVDGDENEGVKLLYEVSIRVYDCKNFEYPNKEEWDLYDGVLWSGSSFAAQRNDDLWVIRLKEEIRRKITLHKRKTLVICLGQHQQLQMITTDQQSLSLQNSCSKVIASASNARLEDEEEENTKEQQNEDDEGPFMVRFQANQEYNFWSKATSSPPASIVDLRSELEESSDENNYNVVNHIAETCEKFGWFPSADAYRLLIKRTVSSSSFSTLGSVGSIPSIGSSLQFYNHNHYNFSSSPKTVNSENSRKVYFTNCEMKK